MAAGWAVDQLAQDYAGQPVVFIKYDVDHAPASRDGRWWAAYSGGGVVYLPCMMVDSGNQISNGRVDYYGVYRGMVDTALARPAQGEIQAYWWRAGNRVEFSVQVKNLSTVTLSGVSNLATVHAIVYEDTRVKVTNRFARAAVETPISGLAPGATAVFQLQTPDLTGANWDRLHAVVLVDYRPSGWTGAFDMLQAAVASRLSAPFSARPDTLTFMVAPTDLSVSPASVTLEGPNFLGWTATGGASWLTTTPSSGPMTTRATISVLKNQMHTGWQQSSVTFTATGGSWVDQVVVNAYLGPVHRVYLPLALRP